MRPSRSVSRMLRPAPRGACGIGHARLLFLRRQRLAWKQRVIETEPGEVTNAHRVQDAVEVIALVLHHAGVKAGDLAHEALAALVVPGVFEPRVAGYPAAHAGNGKAALPARFHVVAERAESRIDEHGIGHFLDVGIAR